MDSRLFFSVQKHSCSILAFYFIFITIRFLLLYFIKTIEKALKYITISELILYVQNTAIPYILLLFIRLKTITLYATVLSSFIQTLLSVLEFHQIMCIALVDFTTGRELHPALKIFYLIISYSNIYTFICQTILSYYFNVFLLFYSHILQNDSNQKKHSLHLGRKRCCLYSLFVDKKTLLISTYYNIHRDNCRD